MLLRGLWAGAGSKSRKTFKHPLSNGLIPFNRMVRVRTGLCWDSLEHQTLRKQERALKTIKVRRGTGRVAFRKIVLVGGSRLKQKWLTNQATPCVVVLCVSFKRQPPTRCAASSDTLRWNFVRSIGPRRGSRRVSFRKIVPCGGSRLEQKRAKI